MIVEFEGREYQWDPEKAIRVGEARFIKKHLHMGLRSFNNALADGDPDCLQVLLYLLIKFNGDNPGALEALEFSPSELMASLDACYWAEAVRLAEIEDQKKEEAEAAGKGRAASSGGPGPNKKTRAGTPTSGKKPTRTSSASPTSATSTRGRSTGSK